MSLPSDKFFMLVGPRWKLAKAICIHESNGDEIAVGDDGDAQGLFQMHAAFAHDYVVPAANPIMIALRGVPWVSIQIMRTFLAMHANDTDYNIIGIFHNGEVGWQRDGDTDGYVADVIKILGGL